MESLETMIWHHAMMWIFWSQFLWIQQRVMDIVFFFKKKKARGARVNIIKPLKDWPLSVGSGKMFMRVCWQSADRALTGMSWFLVWCFHEDTVILCSTSYRHFGKKKNVPKSKTAIRFIHHLGLHFFSVLRCKTNILFLTFIFYINLWVIWRGAAATIAAPCFCFFF